MPTLTTVHGLQFNFSADSVVAIVDRDASTCEDVTCVYGITKNGFLKTNESVQGLMSRLGLDAKFAQLTRPNGSPVWINKSSVSVVRPPLPGEYTDGVNAIVFTSALTQGVGESPSDTMAALNFPDATMKIFLSHKGFNKPMVRQFKTTLTLLGFDPWLDEDAMPAGTNLERGILKGFTNSCAAVFFVTPEFKDENFLATEVDYAIKEKRAKAEKFAIITLLFGNGTAKGSIPDLLHGYVWKEPKTDLEALQEIIRALPIHVGSVRWR